MSACARAAQAKKSKKCETPDLTKAPPVEVKVEPSEPSCSTGWQPRTRARRELKKLSSE